MAEQVSFASGELNPLLHARVDLARYATGLAELKNMIVLPHGGVTRRGGFQSMGAALSHSGVLIPFVFNSTDSALLEFGNKTARVWSGETLKATFTTPYALADVKDLRYVQSGNVMFFAHRSYKPQMLTRNSMTSWTMSELNYSGGPWIDGAEWNSAARLYLYGSGTTRTIKSLGAGIFSSGLIGTLLKIEYAVEANTQTIYTEAMPASGRSSSFEMKGTLNVQTSGEWNGKITIQRSTDGGSSWVTIRQYIRSDYETQGQWDFTLSEAEENVLYVVEAQHVPTTSESQTGNYPIWAASNTGGLKNSKERGTVTISASGFLKSEVYKITAISDSTTATAVKQGNTIGTDSTGSIRLWSMGAWGEIQGYPGAVAMYQDRLVFAGSTLQPQTLWMSRTGDYADFSVSEPLSDDDAVNITLAGTKADRIHSLVAGVDLLAFTTGGEWRIKGYGDSGAITPTGIVAHEQTNIGSKEIQPLQINGRIILVQAQGQKVYALGYDLNTDGYSGSEISILSSHIFDNKEINSMAYQATPNSILWFGLTDRTLAACTYNPEHEVIGWSRHTVLKGVRTLGAVNDGIYAIVYPSDTSDKYYLMKQSTTQFGDYDAYNMSQSKYESRLRTLRLNTDSDGMSLYTRKKLIARVIVSAYNSHEAWAAPGDYDDEYHNWDRRRKLGFDATGYVEDVNIQMDNGFSEYASVQIRSTDYGRLTVAAITPVFTGGG